MTTEVMWFCADCDLPVTFTCDVDRLGPGKYRVHADPHINAHLAQHQQRPTAA